MKVKKPWKGSRHEDMRLLIPCQFLMLCKLVNVTPHQLLHDFMNTLSLENYGLDKQQQDLLLRYFIQGGYGQSLYSPEDISAIFNELGAISTLWPADAPMEVLNRHTKWRKMYHKYWFKKWWGKLRRK